MTPFLYMQHRNSLMSEITTVEGLLAEAPAEQVITRVSLFNRLGTLSTQLAALECNIALAKTLASAGDVG